MMIAIVIPIGEVGGGRPSHPIAWPQPPVDPGYGVPLPPQIWPSPGHPAHPIAPGGPPGQVMPPIYYPPGVNVPVFPTHPIAPGGSPPGIWGGSGQPMPTPPIYLPPDGSTPPPDVSGPGVPPGWELLWSPRYGWVWVKSGGKPSPVPLPPGHVDNTLPEPQPVPTPM